MHLRLTKPCTIYASGISLVLATNERSETKLESFTFICGCCGLQPHYVSECALTAIAQGLFLLKVSCVPRCKERSIHEVQLAEPYSHEHSHSRLKAASKDAGVSSCLFTKVRRSRLHPADPAGDGQQQCVHGTCRVDQAQEQLENVLCGQEAGDVAPEPGLLRHSLSCVVFIQGATCRELPGKQNSLEACEPVVVRTPTAHTSKHPNPAACRSTTNQMHLSSLKRLAPSQTRGAQ